MHLEGKLSMSRRAFVGGSSGTYNVRASELAREKHIKSIRCTVFFLDESQQVFEVQKRAKGQILLDLVFQHLELIEKDYFGLQFTDHTPNPDGMRWLDPSKSIKRQMKAGSPYLLYFRVKFYVSDPSKLQEEYTRYHFFLQIKKDISEGRLVVPPPTGSLLASYAVQSELGDYNVEEHKQGYLNQFTFMSGRNEEMERKITELHKLHKGQMPADAEYNFLDHAKRLDLYGVELHRARLRDSTNAEIQLGVSSVGLQVFQNNFRKNTFSWAKIVKISFKRKQFFIQLRREGTEHYDNLLGFNMLSYRSCKNLWKSCVEHHTFFRLHVPRPVAKRSLFSLGSKFRYSGRTEYQTLEEGKRRAKLERTFIRSPSKRYARQTVPTITRDDEKSKSKQVVSDTNNSHQVRHYDSFNNKVQTTENDRQPRKAWSDANKSDEEGFQQETRPDSRAFTPSIPPRMLHYMDEESASDEIYDLPSYTAETTMTNGETHGLVTIHMKPDNQGRYGFNVKGGADQNLPILVSRVAPNTPADTCIPRLNEGDQVLLINGKDVTKYAHDQVVRTIRGSREAVGRDLVLTVRPQAVYVGDDLEEPEFQYVPDIAHISTRIPRSDALSESMLLLSEGLESGAAIAQFEQLFRKKPGMTMYASKAPENISKNRYRDISPYDISRVILQSSLSGNYVNANHVNMEIPTSGIVNRYIASQGPLPQTCVDFWQMLWEQQSTLIVMLTTISERGRIKCHQYWPQIYESVDFGKLQVTCLREDVTHSFAFREFTLINKENTEERHITQMQYIAWPDHGVPEDASDFLSFVLKVRQNRLGMVEPTIVHCSAGIGRTGVMVLMETAMCLIEANEPVYPLDVVRSMREQRAMMIQTASQYKFVCDAIIKVYNEGIVSPLDEYQRR